MDREDHLHEDLSAPTSRRNQVACEECRKHKKRCCGGNPCTNCSRRRYECLYRLKARPKRRGRSSAAHHHTFNPSREICAGVSATHKVSPSRTIELYYGSSSNFAFLQQLYRRLASTLDEVPENRREVQDSNDGLDTFQYRSVCFNSQLNDLNKADFDNLPAELAETFLNSYFTTVYTLFPTPSKEVLLEAASQFLLVDKQMLMDPLDRAIIQAVLAIGAIFAQENTWSQALFEAAQRDGNPFHQAINTQAVQLYMLLISLDLFIPSWILLIYLRVHAQFQICLGRYNSAYLYLGTASRIAHAVGLHKGIEKSANSAMVSSGKLTVLLCLFVQESLLCLAFGRSPSISLPANVSISKVEDLHVIYSLTDLAKIATRIQHIPQKKFQTMETVYMQCDAVGSDLKEFGKNIRPGLDVALDSDLQVDDVSTVSVVVKLMYEYAMMLAYRPILVVCALYKQHLLSTNSKSSKVSLAASPQVILASQQASKKAVIAARNMISMVDGFVDIDANAKSFTWHALYLESACFVLIFDLIYSPANLTTNALYIERGLKAMEKLTAKQNIINCIVGIRTIFDRALNIGQRPETQDHDLLRTEECQSPVASLHSAEPAQHSDMIQPCEVELPNVDRNISVDDRNTFGQNVDGTHQSFLLEGPSLQSEASILHFNVDWFGAETLTAENEFFY